MDYFLKLFAMLLVSILLQSELHVMNVLKTSLFCFNMAKCDEGVTSIHLYGSDTIAIVADELIFRPMAPLREDMG